MTGWAQVLLAVFVCYAVTLLVACASAGVRQSRSRKPHCRKRG